MENRKINILGTEYRIGKPTKYQRTVIWRKINWLDIAEKIAS